MQVKYDQHFLESKNTLLLEKNSANIKDTDVIFEIGPGDGRLSEFLLQANPKKLISVEMDENMDHHLKKIKEKYPNFDYLIGNGLEEINNFKFNKLVSNIPYSITEPLYNKILELKIPFVLLLHGNTFFNIINDDTNKWHYYVNSFYNIDKLLDVAGNAFNPPAKTTSTLIKLELKKEDKLTKKEKLIQTIFSKKERSTKNTIIFTLVDYNKTKKEAKKIYEENFKLNSIVEKTKFDNISNKQFLEILHRLENIILSNN